MSYKVQLEQGFCSNHEKLTIFEFVDIGAGGEANIVKRWNRSKYSQIVWI